MRGAQWCVLTSTLLVSPPLLADTQKYCPQRHGYIQLGMTEAQVIAACGDPLTKQGTNQPVTEKVPVKQLIYTTLNQGSVYPSLDPIYQTWSIPSGTTGISLQVSIINNKVSGIMLNGSSTNAATVCGGVNFQNGDDESEVYSACGMPNAVNNTFVNQPVASNQHPQVWIYQVDQYQPPFSLTFVNGKLQSIN